MTADPLQVVEMLQQRADYVAGLRALADLLDEDATLPMPFEGNTVAMSVFTQTKAEAAAYARAMGKASKKYIDRDVYGFELRGSLLGLSLLVYAPREQVCTKVVLGTREVTDEIPDPEALAQVPTITVTRTVEDVEWVCELLTAPVIS